MKKIPLKKMEKEKGFTLIELLIVIGIIAILAAAVVIAINPAKHFEQARNSQRWSDISNLSDAVYTYIVDTEGQWPPCLVETSTTSPADAYECKDDLTPDYISAIPFDPQSTSATTTGYKMFITGDNRLKIYVSTTTPGLTDDVSGIEILR